jgi:hypothetical protein
LPRPALGRRSYEKHKQNQQPSYNETAVDNIGEFHGSADPAKQDNPGDDDIEDSREGRALARVRGFLFRAAMSMAPGVYAKVRGEIVALFGWNAESLSPEQTLRIDCAVAMRIGLDDLQGRVMRGESVDMAKMLTISEALARILPPTVLATPPAEQRSDPRQVMWEIYSQMRLRGEIDLKPDAGLLQAEIDELTAENERLRAQLAGGLAPALPDVPMLVESVPREASTIERMPRGASTAIDPTEGDVVPPGEIGGECYAGMRPGPDDPPRRSPPVIEGRAVPAAPAYDYSREQGWKDFVEPDGTIRSTPRGRGHWWGPV